MNLKQLNELRATKQAEMESIASKHADNMSQDVLETVKSIKDEIRDIDMSIEMQNEIRSVAVKTSTPEKTYKSTQEELRNNFNNYIRGNIEQREFEKIGTEIRAQNTDNASDLVHTEFSDRLIETILEYGSILPKVDKMPATNGVGGVEINLIDDTANVGVWTSEGGSIADADFSTSTKTMNAYKCATSIKVSKELINDNAFNLETYINKSLAMRLARTIESALISGDGTAKPEGILTDANTVAKVTGAFGVTDIEDLEQMIFAIDPSERANAQFIVSDSLMQVLTFSKDADGRPLLQTKSGSTPSAPVTYSLFGYNIDVNYELGDASTTGQDVAIFGNFKKYLVRNTQNVEIERDPYTSMGTGEVQYYATVRIDGKVISAQKSFAKLTVA